MAIMSPSLGARPSSAQRQREPAAASLQPQIFRRFLAAARDYVEGDLVAFPQVNAGALDGRNMDENVLATAVRRDKPVTLGRVEPLHSTTRHVALPCNN